MSEIGIRKQMGGSRAAVTLTGHKLIVTCLASISVFAMMGMLSPQPTHADSSVTPTSNKPTETDTPTPTPTITPTLGLPITRTPGSAERCPTPTGKTANISPDTNFWIDQNFVPQPILDYLNTTGTASGLEEALTRN